MLGKYWIVAKDGHVFDSMFMADSFEDATNLVQTHAERLSLDTILINQAEFVLCADGESPLEAKRHSVDISQWVTDLDLGEFLAQQEAAKARVLAALQAEKTSMSSEDFDVLCEAIRNEMSYHLESRP